MLWFVLGFIFGLALGMRDKFLDLKEISNKIVNGKMIQIGEDFYKASKINIDK